MIKQNKKICKSCKTEQFIFSKGRCKFCTSLEDSKPLSRNSIIPKQSEKNKAYRKTQSEIRNVFFEHHINLCKRSEEDGAPIYNPTRANICHLFYKRTYKSVQAHLSNFVYLTNEQHEKFDRLLDCNNFEALENEFKCWGLVVERMKALLPEVKENGKLKMLFEDYIKAKLCT